MSAPMNSPRRLVVALVGGVALWGFASNEAFAQSTTPYVTAGHNYPFYDPTLPSPGFIIKFGTDAGFTDSSAIFGGQCNNLTTFAKPGLPGGAAPAVNSTITASSRVDNIPVDTNFLGASAGGTGGAGGSNNTGLSCAGSAQPGGT